MGMDSDYTTNMTVIESHQEDGPPVPPPPPLCDEDWTPNTRIRKGFFGSLVGKQEDTPSGALSTADVSASIHIRGLEDEDMEAFAERDLHASAFSLFHSSFTSLANVTSSSPKPDPKSLTVNLRKEQDLACEQARQQFEEDFRCNEIRDLSSRLPHFKKEEILHGKFLGRGTTGVVVQINGFRLQPPSHTTTSTRCSNSPSSLSEGIGEEGDASITEDNFRDASDKSRDASAKSLSSFGAGGNTRHKSKAQKAEDRRNFVVQHCYRESGDARYVIKHLRKDVVDQPKKLLQGLADLNLETKFLSSLPHHPNVIKLRAVAAGDRFNPDYFIVIDRLCATLEQRLSQWQQKAKSLDSQRNLVRSLLSPRKNALSAHEEATHLFHDQVWAAYDLASAIAHLHKHRIMHRDIKPSNIGFDIRNDIKIFDFGLGKEIPANPSEDETSGWKLTRMVGTPRYMAPEVALGQLYTQQCDVYSFGIVLWQIMSLKATPFGKTKRASTLDYFFQCVWRGKLERPSMRFKSRTVYQNFSPSLRKLVEMCWLHKWNERPDMKEVESTLQQIVVLGKTSQEAAKTFHTDSLATTSEYLDDSSHGRALAPAPSLRTPSPPPSLEASNSSMRSFLSPRRTSSLTMFNRSNRSTFDDSSRRQMFSDSKSSSFQCSTTRNEASGRRLTHQSRRSTFVLEIDPSITLDDGEEDDNKDDDDQSITIG